MRTLTLLLLATTGNLAHVGPGDSPKGNVVMQTIEVMQLAMFVGAMGAALMSAVWLIRERAKVSAENIGLRGRVAELDMSTRRLEAFAAIRHQRVAIWDGTAPKADVIGNLPEGLGAPSDKPGFLAFGRWLAPASAMRLERAITSLRNSGTGFNVTVETGAGAAIDVQGRISGSLAFVRFMALDGLQADHAELQLEHEKLQTMTAALKAALDAAGFPVWVRDASNRLAWVNSTYAEMVEAGSSADAVRDAMELFGEKVRENARLAHIAGSAFEETVSAVVHGDRHRMKAVDVGVEGWSAGLAVDVSEMESTRNENSRILQSHQETLDQLNTAVAIFDEHQKLRFSNQAFQKLWDMESAFLERHPAHAEVLDRLRSEGKLAEQPEWRNWKDQMLRVYRAIEPAEDWWHLPDGRTIRVIANPHPKGGIILVFENLTEKFDLESRNKTLIRLQGETLGNLAEGVAVFGSDGRVRLSNPAFARLWKIPAETVREGAHIKVVKAACDVQSRNSPWDDFVAAVTGFDEDRTDRYGKSECVDGTILSYSVVPLPNAQVMITVVDVTDTVNVERALKEKNEALQRADELKNSFVQHMSYELRSPLTNIIGFTDMMRMPEVGPLNERQSEYIDHISDSSSTLLAIVNDILDLATLDAGMMQLEVAQVSVGEIVNAAASQMTNRLREHALKLDVEVDPAAGVFNADRDRVRQVLVNLLSNAANYAPEGSAVKLSARREGGDVVFSVHDKGPGIPADVFGTIFKRFEPTSNGGRRRGAGLGLAIVKSFMELHGGTVAIDTGEGRGTVVTCRFPAVPEQVRDAAE